MPLMEDFATKDARNIFRGQVGIVAVAPYATAALTKAALFNTTRTVVVTTTSAAATITGPANSFTTADVGAAITGTGIPAATTILSYQSATAVTMSANATASGSPTATITPAVAQRGTLKTLPTGWTQLGWCSTDGITQSRDVAISETPAWGAFEPLSRLVTSKSATLQVVALESSKIVDELFYMTSLAGVIADSSGVVNWQEPDVPALIDRRMLALAKFENASGEWYEAVQYPRASFQSNGDEVWDLGDNGNARPLQASAQRDDVLGFAIEHFKSGPGFNSTAAGYAV